MKRLSEIYTENQKAETTRRLEIERKARAAGYRVTGWRDGKPKVRKQAGSKS